MPAGSGAATRSDAAGDHDQRRDWGHLYSALDAALAGVKVALPLTLDDAVALFDLMRGIAQRPLILEVMHDHRRIIVRIFDGKQQIYTREVAPRG